MVPTLQGLGLDRLSLDHRLAVAEAIWDSVVREAETCPLTPTQRAEWERHLGVRIARPEAFTPWEQSKARALARVKG